LNFAVEDSNFHKALKSGAQDMGRNLQKRSSGIRFYFQKRNKKE